MSMFPPTGYSATPYDVSYGASGFLTFGKNKMVDAPSSTAITWYTGNGYASLNPVDNSISVYSGPDGPWYDYQTVYGDEILLTSRTGPLNPYSFYENKTHILYISNNRGQSWASRYAGSDYLLSIEGSIPTNGSEDPLYVRKAANGMLYFATRVDGGPSLTAPSKGLHIIYSLDGGASWQGWQAHANPNILGSYFNSSNKVIYENGFFYGLQENSAAKEIYRCSINTTFTKVGTAANGCIRIDKVGNFFYKQEDGGWNPNTRSTDILSSFSSIGTYGFFDGIWPSGDFYGCWLVDYDDGPDRYSVFNLGETGYSETEVFSIPYDIDGIIYQVVDAYLYNNVLYALVNSTDPNGNVQYYVLYPAPTNKWTSFINTKEDI